MNIAGILNLIRPGAQWALNGDTYAGLLWLDTVQIKPTPAEIETRALEYARYDLQRRLAARRFEKETGGIVWNLKPVHTLRESQTKIAATKYALDRGTITSINWKLADGTFTALTAAQFNELYLAVINHVKTCYDVEMTKLAEITATGTTNLETGWPT